MRDYAKVSPQFWIGETCRELGARGIEGPYMALYMVTAPTSNMLGLYYLPVAFISTETRLGTEAVQRVLKDCQELGFASYDPVSQFVWVHEMAAWQISEQLHPKDKQCAGIQKAYDLLPKNPFLGPWFDRYREAFHLTKRRSENLNDRRGIEGALKPHRSQEQKQEQEQNNSPTLLHLRVREPVQIDERQHKIQKIKTALEKAGFDIRLANFGDRTIADLIEKAVPEEFAGLASGAMTKASPWAWLCATLRNKLGGGQAPTAPAAWWDGGQSDIEAKGLEHGLGRWDQIEQWAAYRGRVMHAAGVGCDRSSEAIA